MSPLNNPAQNTKRFRPGIRTSFIIGLSVMTMLMLVVTGTALISSVTTTRGVDDIVSNRLPATLTTLRLARAGDTLAASGGALVAVRTDNERAAALARVDAAQLALQRSLDELGASVDESGVSQIVLLIAELNDNLDNLRSLVDERLALIELQRVQRGELQTLLQAFQQLATYRVRIIEGDSAVMTMLSQQSEPPMQQIGEIAARTAPLVPLARFYAQVEAIGSRILVASQDPGNSALALSIEVINTLMDNASATLSRLPPDVAREFAELYLRLGEMALSDNGLPQLRQRELDLLANGEVWIAENMQIMSALDEQASALVDYELAAIDNASASVAHSSRTAVWLLVLITSLGVIGLAAFFYVHILKDLLARLSLLSHAMQDIAAGHYDKPLPPVGADELGRLGAAVRQFHAVAVDAARREEELQTLNRQLAELSISDALTGLSNRRHFDEVLAEEWARSLRHAYPMAILMIDVDYFKAFNDRYGHQAGDFCLQTLASVLRSRVNRPGDLVARYGGEEFCVVLSQCELGGALSVAHEIHQAVAALKLPHLDSGYGHITVSIGVAATVPGPGQSAANLLKQADQALYQAKAAGRNQVLTA